MSIAGKLTAVAENTEKVYKAGQDKAWNDFWDTVQNNGNRENYEYFASWWYCEYVRPKYKIVPKTRLLCIFSDNRKLKKIEKEYFDFSKTTATQPQASTYGAYATFRACPMLEEIEDIGIPANGMYQTYNSCTSLHTIEIIRVNEDVQYDAPFSRCHELKNITIDGTIGQNGLNFQWSTKLSKESIESVISHLSDSASGKSVTFSLSSVKKAFETSEGADDGNTSAEWLSLIGTKTNWTITLA